MKNFLNKLKGVATLATSSSATHGVAAVVEATGVLVEHHYSVLKRFDTVFIVDDSGSMHADWKKVRDALIGVIEKSVQYESDGIDIYFFNSPMVVNHLSTSSGVKELFKRVKPEGGSTPTSKALQNVVEPYLKDLESAYKAKMEKPDATHKHIKPLNVVILTDGAPSPGFAPETVIMDAARRLDDVRAPLCQLGLSFVQIGADVQAQRALAYLDDQLKTVYEIRDMVDTTLSPAKGEISSTYLLKALLGGINRKIDRIQ